MQLMWCMMAREFVFRRGRFFSGAGVRFTTLHFVAKKDTPIIPSVFPSVLFSFGMPSPTESSIRSSHWVARTKWHTSLVSHMPKSPALSVEYFRGVARMDFPADWVSCFKILVWVLSRLRGGRPLIWFAYHVGIYDGDCIGALLGESLDTMDVAVIGIWVRPLMEL